ncbi:MAG TPA: peroxiredoxin [Elusimicrobia bacterium]|nr:peroxiredoxin [Elusimicrobiota bacterium]HBT61417.1 peroxiredoxin [Elusimicrobiota bacterium]
MSTEIIAQETTPIAVGGAAPDFRLQDQNGKEFHVGDYLGKKMVILFFYPLDWSPTCTKENACFSQNLSRFEKYGEVAAISTDSVYCHRAWAEKMGLKHRLLADMHRTVVKAYGLYFPDANINQRATVVINKDGKVAWVKVEADIAKERDYNEVEAVLAKLTK